MMGLFRLFHEKRKRVDVNAEQQPLHINGCRVQLTAEPDDAELAAQALLEVRHEGENRGHTQMNEHGKEKGQPHDAAYYQQLVGKISEAHVQERRHVLRYLAYVEEHLSHLMSDAGILTTMERGLYPLQDCIEREGGELKQRWQHCLAECIVRQMNTTETNKSE